MIFAVSVNFEAHDLDAASHTARDIAEALEVAIDGAVSVEGPYEVAPLVQFEVDE